MSLMHILLNRIDADMKSEIGSSRGVLRPYPLRFHVREAGPHYLIIRVNKLITEVSLVLDSAWQHTAVMRTNE